MEENLRNLTNTNKKWNLILLSQKCFLNLPMLEKRTPKIALVAQFETSLTIAHSRKI